LRSWIDEPGDAPVDSPSLCVRGWCFDEADRPVTAGRACVGRKVFAGRGRMPRPDVQAALSGPPESARSGFSVCVRLGSAETLVRLEARVGEDPSWREFQRINLKGPRDSLLSHRLRMIRFRWESGLGRPGALGRLTAAERRFVLARIDENGGHPLRLSPHYAPRPVAPERFPKPGLSAERLPRIAVVTPSFQHGRFLEATLLSVLDQPGVRLDYIVEDGGSADGSVEIISRYAPRLSHWASGADQGQADALRRGFARTEGGPDDVMAYLNSDDLFMPGALRFVAEYFAKHPQVDVVYGHRVLIDDGGSEVGRWLVPRRTNDDLRLFDLIPQETLFWRRRIYQKVGGIDASFGFAVDWDLLLRFADAGARFQRLPWFLGLFRLHPAQKSQALLEKVGIPEMDALRERNFGRTPPREEMVAAMERAQLDSTVVAEWMRRGWRL
jgi:hypothetical protein